MRLETLLLLLHSGILLQCVSMAENGFLPDYNRFNRRNLNDDPFAKAKATPAPLWKQRVERIRRSCEKVKE